MTSGAVDALRADRAALIDVCGDLSPSDWAAPSGCAGWRVQDVVAHMGLLFWLTVDASSLPDTTGVPTEQAQDVLVDSRREWAPGRVLDDYADVSAKALDIAAMLETQDFVMPLGDLGTYHASVLPNAYAFDHYTHIRADLFAPRGPLTDAMPPSDELRLAPTLDWIEVAAPQQNAALAAFVGAIELDVTGTSARTITLGSGDVRARVRCSAHDLVLVATQRATWGDVDVQAAGDDDALALARALHVF